MMMIAAFVMVEPGEVGLSTKRGPVLVTVANGWTSCLLS
jgi:hypothetical protein